MTKQQENAIREVDKCIEDLERLKEGVCHPKTTINNFAFYFGSFYDGLYNKLQSIRIYLKFLNIPDEQP